VNDCLDPDLGSNGVEYALYLPPKEEITIYPKSVRKNTLGAKVKTFRDYQMIPASMVRLLFTNSNEFLNAYKGSILKNDWCQKVSTDFTVIGNLNSPTSESASGPLPPLGGYQQEETNTVNEQKTDENKKKNLGQKNKFIQNFVRR